MINPLALYGLLLLGGSLWGLTIPVTKISVSSGYQPFGLIFWQLALSVFILAGMILLRGKSLVWPRRMTGYLVTIGLIGTLVPNTFSYAAAAQLPGGVMAIVIAMVPMFSLPIAIALGRERMNPMRMSGVMMGAVAVILLIAPREGLSNDIKVVFVLIALIAPFCYGIEGNYVASRGTGPLDPVQLLFGASLCGLVIIAPLTWMSGQFISPAVAWGAPEWAIVANACLHACAYALYLWLVGRGGAVFASQVSYIVTGTGVLWSIALLSEAYSGWIWSALLLMMTGLALVQPRKAAQ